MIIHREGVAEFKRSEAFRELLEDVAQQIVRNAQMLAAKRTGAGARSIQAEPVRTADGWEFRVSWDKRHGYMRFPEFGTRHMRAQPALRRAAEMVRGPVSLRKAIP